MERYAAKTEDNTAEVVLPGITVLVGDKGVVAENGFFYKIVICYSRINLHKKHHQEKDENVDVRSRKHLQLTKERRHMADCTLNPNCPSKTIRN